MFRLMLTIKFDKKLVLKINICLEKSVILSLTFLYTKVLLTNKLNPNLNTIPLLTIFVKSLGLSFSTVLYSNKLLFELWVNISLFQANSNLGLIISAVQQRWLGDMC